MTQSTRQTLHNIAHAVLLARDGLEKLRDRNLQADFADAKDADQSLHLLALDLEAVAVAINHMTKRPYSAPINAVVLTDAALDAIVAGMSPYVSSCSEGSFLLRLKAPKTDACRATLATMLTARGWTRHQSAGSPIIFWHRPGTIAERLAQASAA